jgi:hypothetical protein
MTNVLTLDEIKEYLGISVYSSSNIIWKDQFIKLFPFMKDTCEWNNISYYNSNDFEQVIKELIIKCHDENKIHHIYNPLDKIFIDKYKCSSISEFIIKGISSKFMIYALRYTDIYPQIFDYKQHFLKILDWALIFLPDSTLYDYLVDTFEEEKIESQEKIINTENLNKFFQNLCDESVVSYLKIKYMLKFSVKFPKFLDIDANDGIAIKNALMNPNNLSNYELYHEFLYHSILYPGTINFGQHNWGDIFKRVCKLGYNNTVKELLVNLPLNNEINNLKSIIIGNGSNNVLYELISTNCTKNIQILLKYLRKNVHIDCVNNFCDIKETFRIFFESSYIWAYHSDRGKKELMNLKSLFLYALEFPEILNIDTYNFIYNYNYEEGCNYNLLTCFKKHIDIYREYLSEKINMNNNIKKVT